MRRSLRYEPEVHGGLPDRWQRSKLTVSSNWASASQVSASSRAFWTGYCGEAVSVRAVDDLRRLLMGLPTLAELKQVFLAWILKRPLSMAVARRSRHKRLASRARALSQLFARHNRRSRLVRRPHSPRHLPACRSRLLKSDRDEAHFCHDLLLPSSVMGPVLRRA
jgi:hypothetical protein